MSRVHEELLPQLKSSDRKLRLERALQSINDDAVQRDHKNMQQIIESFLHMPDNLATDAPAWCRKAFRRCAVTLVGFRWPPPISSWTPLGGLPVRPSARTMQFLLLKLQMTKFGENTLASVRPVQKIIKMFGNMAFLTSKHEFQRINYSNSVHFRK